MNYHLHRIAIQRDDGTITSFYTWSVDCRRYWHARRSRPGRRGVCRVCGCTQRWGCPGGCSWANPEQTLCSQCEERKGQ